MIDGTTRILVKSGYKKVSSLSFDSEESERVKLKLVNGIELIGSPEQLLLDYDKRYEAALGDFLQPRGLVKLNYPSETFDNLELHMFEHLKRLGNFDLGVLVGLIYSVSPDGRILDIPKVRKAAWKELERLLLTAEVKFTKEEYYKRADRIKYTITDEEFLNEIEPFLVRGEIPEIFWDSKILWHGFLKAVFSFSFIATKMFTIRSGKDSLILKDIQQGLRLFGINSTYSKGLKMSQLMVFKNNCYKLAYYIGAFNPDRYFEGLDYKRFLSYTDRDSLDTMYSRIYSIEKIGIGTLYNVNLRCFIANGVILENYE